MREVKRKRSSRIILHFSDYLRKNWANLVVLGFILTLSASASIIIYEFASQSISDVSNQMLTTALGDIKSRITDYLTGSIAIIPSAKAFLQARQIDTGAEKNPDIVTASRLWGYFFNNNTASVANSLFYMDQFGNNLGWGNGPTGPAILLYWPSMVSGLNTYIPVNGALGNLSEPGFHQNVTLVFPDLDIERESGQPFWQNVYLLRISQDSVLPLISYSEPAYFNDNGEFCCIVGTNIYINAFEAVMASYTIAKNSKIFVTTDQGTLVADSVGGVQLYLDELNNSPLQTATLPNATDHSDPAIARAAQFIIEHFGSFAQISAENNHATYKFKGQTQILLVTQITRNNLKMNIAIVVPYSSFFSKIELSRRITIAFTVIAVVCGFARYLVAWKLMVKVAPGDMSTASLSAGYPSTINVALSNTSNTSSTTSLFTAGEDSPAMVRKDLFGDNSPAVVDKDLP